MKIAGKHYRSIWVDDDGWSVHIIDQTRLPHAFEILTLTTCEDAARAIETMQTRGAPLIGATAAYGLCLALRAGCVRRGAGEAAARLSGRGRPRSISPGRWTRSLPRCATGHAASGWRRPMPGPARSPTTMSRPAGRSGAHGVRLIREVAVKHPARPVNVLTHCNAGWLATVDWGTALAPIYMAHDEGIDVHVWVDETRPRNQGAALTALELGAHGVPHTIVADNAGGHLMQHGKVDLVHRRHRPDDRDRRCRQQDRHLSQGARRAGQRGAVLCRAAPLDHRLAGAGRPCRDPDRGALAAGADPCHRPQRRRRAGDGAADRRRAARRPIRRSTSRRRGW